MTFSEWVKQIGMEKAMQVLDRPQNTIKSWCTFARFPRPEALALILHHSHEVVDVAQWVKDYDSDRKIQEVTPQ